MHERQILLGDIRVGSALPVWILFFLILGTAAFLTEAFRPENLNTDTAQYVVTARHLLRGEGLSTSLIYFEEQMAAGKIPAPQTVWPPGYPMVIALAMATGIPFTHAPFIIAALSHMLAALTLYALLRRIRCEPAIAVGGAIAYLVTIFANVLVLRGLSESTFTLSTLLCAWAFANANDSAVRRRWLLGAGAAAAAAFLFRYAGITFVAAFGLAMAAGWLVQRSVKNWWDAVIAMAFPVVCVVALFLRNYLLVGSFTGGPTLEHGSSIVDVALSMRWSIEQMIGAYDSAGRWLAAVMLVSFSWVAVEIVREWRRPSEQTAIYSGLAQTLLLSCTYVVLTLLMYGYMAYQRQPEMITARYLLPLLPFIVIIACSAIAWLQRSLPNTRRLVVNAAAAVALLAFVTVQSLAVSHWKVWLRDDAKFALMIDAMNEQVGSSTIRDLIKSRAQNGSILAVDGQLLGMWLDLPAVGLTESSWTRRTWTADEVHKLVRQFNVRVVCAFPSIFDENAKINGHRQFFIDLERGNVPSWLTLIARTPSASIYGVLPALGTGSSEP